MPVMGQFIKEADRGRHRRVTQRMWVGAKGQDSSLHCAAKWLQPLLRALAFSRVYYTRLTWNILKPLSPPQVFHYTLPKKMTQKG